MIKKSFLIPLLLILSVNSYAEETRYNPFTNKPDFKNNKASEIKVIDPSGLYGASASPPTVQSALNDIAASYPTVTATPYLKLDASNDPLTGDLSGVSYTIGANTLTTSEWAFLDGQDQAVKTPSDVTFNSVLAGTLTTTDTIDVQGSIVNTIGDVTVNDPLTVANDATFNGNTAANIIFGGLGNDTLYTTNPAFRMTVASQNMQLDTPGNFDPWYSF